MPGLEFLDLAIGLVFLYLLIGPMCLVVAEFVEALWKKRSRHLLAALQEMLNDPDGRLVKDIGKGVRPV